VEKHIVNEIFKELKIGMIVETNGNNFATHYENVKGEIGEITEDGFCVWQNLFSGFSNKINEIIRREKKKD